MLSSWLQITDYSSEYADPNLEMDEDIVPTAASNADITESGNSPLELDESNLDRAFETTTPSGTFVPTTSIILPLSQFRESPGGEDEEGSGGTILLEGSGNDEHDESSETSSDESKQSGSKSVMSSKRRRQEYTLTELTPCTKYNYIVQAFYEVCKGTYILSTHTFFMALFTSRLRHGH